MKSKSGHFSTVATLPASSHHPHGKNDKEYGDDDNEVKTSDDQNYNTSSLMMVLMVKVMGLMTVMVVSRSWKVSDGWAGGRW